MSTSCDVVGAGPAGSAPATPLGQRALIERRHDVCRLPCAARFDPESEKKLQGAVTDAFAGVCGERAGPTTLVIIEEVDETRTAGASAGRYSAPTYSTEGDGRRATAALATRRAGR